jgi:hypothetical protein
MSEIYCNIPRIVSTIEWISNPQTTSLSVCSLNVSFLQFSIIIFHVQILYFRFSFVATTFLVSVSRSLSNDCL